MACRNGYWCVVIIGVMGLPGCGLMQTTNHITRESLKTLKLRPTDYRDTTSETDDEWTSVGRTASTVRGIEKDSDPIRKMIHSPKALSIERNLGIE